MPSPDCPCDLNGLKVLVTRPREQAAPLAAAIRDCGGNVELLPLLVIEKAVGDDDRRKLQSAQAYDDLLFVSPNAVHHASADLEPGDARIIAIGRSTAKLLQENGLRVGLVPERSTSEGLLGEAGLGEMTGRRVLIVRGRGGREHLAEQLRGAGAEVEYAEVYRRAMPPPPPAELLQAWTGRVEAMIVTSETMLDNLVELTAGDRRVLETPLVVISERLQNAAKTLGFSDSLRARNPYAADLLKALCQLAQRRHRTPE